MLEGRVGRYVVERLIGAGGMGEVYLARDTDLGRPVALKVLPADVVEDDVRRERLRREARLAAALSHPHVATVFEVLDHGGTIVLAMEYVPGPSLRRLVASGPLPLARLLRIGAQVADALAAAHRSGIVHRDVKPDNILFTDDGHAKVTDFGCARELPPPPTADASSVPTVADTLTKPGIALGTVNYMAPEQIQGRPATPESDIFGLGVSLYEAATGRRAFDARSSAGIVAAVLRDRPPAASALNPEIPPDLDRILDRALEKDPANRYHDARDLAGDLRDLRRRIESGTTTGTLAAVPAPSRARRRIAIVAGIAVVALAAAAALYLGGSLAGRRSAGAVGGTAAAGGRLHVLVTSEGELRDPAISRDGTMVAYVEEKDGATSLYVTRTHGGARILLERGPEEISGPAFSPDGETIAFTRWDPATRRPSLALVPSLGGEARPLARDASSPAWAPDASTVAFVSWAGEPERALATIGIDGSGFRVVFRTGADRPIVRSPAYAPDGRMIACVLSRGGQDAEIWLIPVDGGKPRLLLSDPAGVYSDHPAYTADGGAIVHVSNRGGATNLWSAPVGGGGPPVRLTVGAGPDRSPDVSADGRIVFADNVSRASLVVVDLEGGGIREIARHGSVLWAPRFSPDGREIAFSRAETDGAWHVWIVPATGGTPRQLTFGAVPQIYPRFTPDGRSVVFQTWSSGKDRVWRVPREGGATEPLTPEGEDDGYPDVSPDGTRIVYSRSSGGTSRICVSPIGGGPSVPLTAGDSTVPAWSPDGTLIAFARDRGYEGGIFVVRPDGTGEKRISATGGWPVWTRDGRAVAYEAKGPGGDQENWVVPIAGGEPRRLAGPVYGGTNYPFDFSPDGRLLATTTSDVVASEIWLLEP